jgi:hypothetical protein
VYVPPAVKRRILIACGILPVLLPGWGGDLVPVPHEEIIVEAAKHDADEVFGASRPGERAGEEWHAQFMGSTPAQVLDFLNLRGFATHVVPPAYVAHIPPGADLLPERADGYFKVVTHWRWPWWWPGGGVDWTMPAR